MPQPTNPTDPTRPQAQTASDMMYDALKNMSVLAGEAYIKNSLRTKALEALAAWEAEQAGPHYSVKFTPHGQGTYSCKAIVLLGDVRVNFGQPHDLQGFGSDKRSALAELASNAIYCVPPHDLPGVLGAIAAAMHAVLAALGDAKKEGRDG